MIIFCTSFLYSSIFIIRWKYVGILYSDMIESKVHTYIHIVIGNGKYWSNSDVIIKSFDYVSWNIFKILSLLGGK